MEETSFFPMIKTVFVGCGRTLVVLGYWGESREGDLGTILANKMADDGFEVVKKRKGCKYRNYKEKNGSCTKLWNSGTSKETTCYANELKSKIENCRYEKGLL